MTPDFPDDLLTYVRAEAPIYVPTYRKECLSSQTYVRADAPIYVPTYRKECLSSQFSSCATEGNPTNENQYHHYSITEGNPTNENQYHHDRIMSVIIIISIIIIIRVALLLLLSSYEYCPRAYSSVVVIHLALGSIPRSLDSPRFPVDGSRPAVPRPSPARHRPRS